MASRRPSALLVLGVYAGVIAALVTVPVILPVLARLVAAEVKAGDADLYSRTASYGLSFSAEAGPPEDAVYVRVTDTAGGVLYLHEQVPPPADLEDRVCGTPRAAVGIPVQGQSYGASCWRGRDRQVVVLWRVEPRSYLGIGAFVVVLALIAALINALGVTQLIRPMARISAALDQVSMGERNIKMKPTGLYEIDRLIERLNATASAIETRENEILARVQVIQEMARLVAHEVRNPLQSLTLFSQLLVDASEPAERKELHDSIKGEIQVLDDVVQRLLREGTSRGALRLQPERVDLQSELMRLQKVRHREAQQRGVQVVATIEPDLVASVDRMLLLRALQNLINNALRAVPDDNGLVTISAAREGDELVIAVDDNGPGVDPHLGERIFELNVTGGGGHGLGLSLTRGVAEAHGGSVRFLESPLGGARFEIRIPSRA